MTLGQQLRHRRALRDHEEALRSNGALYGVAQGLRASAQPYLDQGRPDLARPYLDEAELFEGAVQRVPGL